MYDYDYSDSYLILILIVVVKVMQILRENREKIFASIKKEEEN